MFEFLSVWGLSFGIFRHNFSIYIIGYTPRFGHGINKILFLTKLFFHFLLIFSTAEIFNGGGRKQFTGGDKTGAVVNKSPPPHSMVLKDSLYVFSVLDFKNVQLQILQRLSFHGK
jgi:hypothetical protein